MFEDTRKSASKKPKGRDGGGFAGVTKALYDNLHALATAVATRTAPIACEPWEPAAREPAPLDVSTIELPRAPAIAHAALAPVRPGFLVTSYSRIKAQAKLEIEVVREEVTGEDRSRQAPSSDDLPGGPATGHLLHEVLEHADLAVAMDAANAAVWSLRPEVAALFARAERRHGVSARHRSQAAELAYRALRSEIVAGDLRLAPLGRARLAREVEFVFPLPMRDPAAGERGFVKGFIDALARWDGDERWFVVDYKSDVIDLSAEAAEAHVNEHYDMQVRLYALAAAAMMKLRDAGDHARRFGGLLYYFLRSGRVVHRAPTAADLDAYRAELAAKELT